MASEINNPAFVSHPKHISRWMVMLMALGTGVSVANLYYCQPLLHVMATSVHSPDGLIGWIPALTQMGAAVGMLLFVPLGDVVERRALTVRMCLCAAAAVSALALAPSFALILAASFLVGLACNIPHLILPYAAQLAPDKERGKVVGTVISGLLVGVLVARTASGMIGSYFGWRTVYGIAAVLMLSLALLIKTYLPPSLPSAEMRYRELLASLPALAKAHASLQEAAITGGLLFASFNAFWTTLILLLQAPPFHYGERTAGLFGLVAAAGAAAAPAVGRLMDHHSPRVGVRYAIFLSLFAFAIMAVRRSSLWGIGLGVILLDIGVQTGHVSNQTRIYAEFPRARSRANTVYMICYFLGGACGSVLATWSWHWLGWTGVCACASAFLLTAMLSVRRKDVSAQSC